MTFVDSTGNDLSRGATGKRAWVSGGRKARLLQEFAVSGLCAARFAKLAGVKPVGPRQPAPKTCAACGIPDADREALQKGAMELAAEIQALQKVLEKKPSLLALLPDVEIFHKSVDWALKYNEFFKPTDANSARAHLDQGKARQEQKRCAKGKPRGQPKQDLSCGDTALGSTIQYSPTDLWFRPVISLKGTNRTGSTSGVMGAVKP
jgi:hypothetical protein